METLLRREFLARSALGGAALLGADRLACGAEGVRAANVAEEQLGEFDPEAPSNALVTGVDPDEMVLFAFASANLDSWQEAGIMSFHRPESQPGIHRGRQVHVGASIWHRRNVLLGLYGQWVGPENNLHPDVRMNLGLIISNDGLRYREPVPDYPFIRWRSEQSDWKTLRLLQGQGFVNHGGRTYIFYGAGSGEEVPVANHCMVGLATLPRDRFRHLQPGTFDLVVSGCFVQFTLGKRIERDSIHSLQARVPGPQLDPIESINSRILALRLAAVWGTDRGDRWQPRAPARTGEFSSGSGKLAPPLGVRTEMVDLLERIRLGKNALLGGLDPTQGHLPYWNCGIKNGDLTGFELANYQSEGLWNRVHNVGRARHGLSEAGEVLGEPPGDAIMADLRAHLFQLFEAGDGLPGGPDGHSGKRLLNLHNVRETLHGLTALTRRGDGEAEDLARRLVRTIRQALDEEGRIHLERLPPSVESYNHQPSMEGRAVDALVRYYRASDDDVALETAGLMTRFALEKCFSESGDLTEEAGTHGHSINALVAGMLALALLTNDAKLLERVRRVYDVGLARFNSSFGWSMEALHKYRLRGEANNSGDLLRASLLLGKGGYPDYYGRAERILRSHLLPSQLVEVANFSDDPHAAENRLRSLASRVRGGFGFPTPNDLQFGPESPVFVYDIVSGAVDALCQAYRAMVGEDGVGIRLNLLLGMEREGLRVRSHLSSEGRIEIANSSGRNLQIRVPSWVPPSQLQLTVNGSVAAARLMGPYLLVAAGAGTDRVRLVFPVPRTRTVESIVYQRFSIDWQGDQIVAMSPPRQPNPSMAPLPTPGIPMFPPASRP